MDFPWVSDAGHGRPMPDGLSQADQLCYQTLAGLYGRYRLGLVRREDAMKDKQRIIGQWQRGKDLERFDSRVAARRAMILKATEAARLDFRLADNDKGRMEAAGRLIRIIDGDPSA